MQLVTPKPVNDPSLEIHILLLFTRSDWLVTGTFLFPLSYPCRQVQSQVSPACAIQHTLAICSSQAVADRPMGWNRLNGAYAKHGTLTAALPFSFTQLLHLEQGVCAVGHNVRGPQEIKGRAQQS
eukprot:1157717-Pelagomonas_calceolata.AAC.4